MSTDITTQETARLEELEAKIEKSIGTFIEVGEALAEIRDAKLYRQTHDTFETYCREKWGMSRRRSYELMEAAETVKALPENVRHGAQNERQARELSKVEPERREEVVTKAVQATGGKLTAAAIKQAAKPEPAPQPEPPAETEEEEVEVIPPTPTPRYIPANGMQYAKIAISQLEKIDRKDKERTAALQHVQKWIAERL